MATIDMPTALSPRVMNALKASPRTVDLRAQVPHFYSLGIRMLELFEEDEIVEVLTDVSINPLSAGCARPDTDLLGLCRLSANAQRILPTTRITRVELLAME